VVATINGTEIRESDLHIQSQITALRQQEYELKRRAAEAAIGRRLVETAARAEGLTIEQYMAKEIDAKVTDPGDDELRALYTAQKDRFSAPFEQVRDQLKAEMREQRIRAARQVLADRLLKDAKIQFLIEPPRFKVDLGDAPRRGPASAPVTIVEFSDYQCPFCKRAQATLAQIASRYGDRVAFVFKDYPLDDLHPQARSASEAARCAGDQGKFWAYHDLLFASSPAFAGDALKTAAEKVGLNPEAFETCLQSKKNAAKVESDRQQGENLGVNGTPAFFVNGIGLSGALPLAEFVRVIDAELTRK
jgi:protein-disulfide isomerase